MTAGWQQPARTPKCAHLAALVTTMFGMFGREEGDVWLCTCGRRYVVRRRDAGDGTRVKVLVPESR